MESLQSGYRASQAALGVPERAPGGVHGGLLPAVRGREWERDGMGADFGSHSVCGGREERTGVFHVGFPKPTREINKPS